MAALFWRAQGQEGLKNNCYVCACWERHHKLKAWECLVCVQSVPEHRQHKQGTHLLSKYLVATGSVLFLALFFPSLPVPLTIHFCSWTHGCSSSAWAGGSSDGSGTRTQRQKDWQWAQGSVVGPAPPSVFSSRLDPGCGSQSGQGFMRLNWGSSVCGTDVDAETRFLLKLMCRVVIKSLLT